MLAGYRGVPLSGYMPIRTEISPLARDGRGRRPWPGGRAGDPGSAGLALKFSRWSPGCALKEGPFGAHDPGNWMTSFDPEILVVPLVAFDRAGGRLGYGGGFYDRTLQGLRARRATLAIGFAYAAQETGELPLEPTDQPLDMVVTEREVITF